MLTFENGENEHTKRIGRQGYAASYTLPMFNDGEFIGFIFFNSDKKDVFTESVLRQIDIYAHMISLTVVNEMLSLKTLTAVIKTTGSISHLRDPETGTHLDRMSRYSRIIAIALAEKFEFSDAYIEHIFMFSPLHDIGKIGIPDNVLFKPEKLNAEEKKVMDTHARKGREMIDELLKNFGLEDIEYREMLRNIAEYHHEAINGSGYPDGLKGDEIPIESRIVAVADVFDALTSKRVYKDAWTNDQAIETMQDLAGKKLDQDCVNALIENLDKIIEVQQQFNENPFG